LAGFEDSTRPTGHSPFSSPASMTGRKVHQSGRPRLKEALEKGCRFAGPGHKL
jgi:hypothetical protein